MGIHVQFNTDDLSTSDIAVLGALARSLADPEWAASAEKPKATGGRPRKNAAPAPAAEEKAGLSVVKNDTDKPETVLAPEESKAAAKVAAETPAAETPAAEPKPEPKPEPAAEETPAAEAEPAAEVSGEEPKAEAVRRATELVHDGRGTEVRAALKEVDAKKVGDLKGDALEGFLKIVRGL